MAFQILCILLSTIALVLAVYACVAHAVAEARVQNALHELRGEVVLTRARTPSGLETRLIELATECASDRTALAKVADRLHRLSGRVQGLTRADSLNADPEPADRDQLRASLLRGHHVGGTNRE